MEIPFEIPESWEWVRLADICSVITDGTHQTPTYSNDGYIFLSSKNVTTGKIDWENVMYIPESLHEQLYARLAPQRGDILLAKNGTTGFSAVVDRDCVFDIYVSLALLRTFQNEIDPYYLRHIMSSSFVQEQFKANLKGIGVPNLHLENIRNTYIPICSMKEQSRILTKIDSLAAYIDKIEHEKGELASAIKLTKQKILSLAIQGKLLPQDPNDEPAFVLLERIKAEHPESNKKASKTSDNSHYENLPFEIPQNWSWCYLEDIATDDLGKTLDKVKNRGEYYPYLRSVNVRWGEISLDDLKEMRFEDKEINQYSIKKGDLLICEGGEAGRCAVWNNKENVLFQNAIHRVRFYNNINPYFYMYVLWLYNDLQILEEHSKGVTIKHLTKSSLNMIPLPLPPLREQKKIVDAFESICGNIHIIIDEL
ncbi:restriction endonuclease subunit S [Macellibacteroides fermentans]|uniref:restriction endonuclease subunit S n=1 Tax=Macellibacteroides fermentans TaxID=879969 RepID=UPI002B3D8280|nr:restriction endonuclease subunit S [Macellibacteroides fermentans]